MTPKEGEILSDAQTAIAMHRIKQHLTSRELSDANDFSGNGQLSTIVEKPMQGNRAGLRHLPLTWTR
jgi:hypothetical protein